MRSIATIFSSMFRFSAFGGSAQSSGEQFPGPLVPPKTAVAVTEDTALALSAVFGATRILAEAVAGIPIYEQVLRKGKWIEDPDGELYRLLQLMPNQYMTYVDFWECIMLNLALRGNGYAKIMRNARGDIIGLYPLAASQTKPIVLKDGTGWYLFSADGEQVLISDEDMLHFRLFGNGRVGLSPLQYGAMSMGIASAADSYASSFYESKGRPGGVLTIDRVLTAAQREQLRAVYDRVNDGVGAGQGMMVLEAGMKYAAVQLAPDTAQMVQTRSFSVKDISRFFGVPAFLLNETEGSTNYGTGYEQQMLGFYNLTLRPYTNRIAATCRKKLLPLADQRKRRVVHDFDELLSTDLRAKAEYFTKLVSNGIISRAEARDRLQWEPHADAAASELTVQSAMIPLSMMGKVPAKSTTNEPGEKDV